MAKNFTASIHLEGRTMPVIVVPTLLQDGMHYEINIPAYPRFWMKWGPMDRYEVVRPRDVVLPDSLVLAVSDVIEGRQA